MNLQGIWNPFMKAPWRSNFHLNINIQEAYWFAEQGSLPECHEPLFTLVEKTAEDGHNTAKEVLGVNRGFATGHRTDVWFPGRLAGNNPRYSMDVMCGAWLTRHMYEHYLFSGDIEFLRNRAWPMIREASLFLLDWLVTDPRSGKLVAGPGASPENFFYDRGQYVRTPDPQDALGSANDPGSQDALQATSNPSPVSNINTPGRRAAVTMGCSFAQEVAWDCFTN